MIRNTSNNTFRGTKSTGKSNWRMKEIEIVGKLSQPMLRLGGLCCLWDDIAVADLRNETTRDDRNELKIPKNRICRPSEFCQTYHARWRHTTPCVNESKSACREWFQQMTQCCEPVRYSHGVHTPPATPLHPTAFSPINHPSLCSWQSCPWAARPIVDWASDAALVSGGSCSNHGQRQGECITSCCVPHLDAVWNSVGAAVAARITLMTATSIGRADRRTSISHARSPSSGHNLKLIVGRGVEIVYMKCLHRKR